MVLPALPVVGGVLLLTYANGANDNFKGVATLHGSGVLGYRTALWAGTGATWLGSVAALLLAGHLVRAFSGKGLVAPEVLAQGGFAAAVALAAAFTVLAATRLGLPVSTTHALIGALSGGGLAAGSLHLHRLGSTFVLPLAFSPLAAALLAGGGYLALRQVRRALNLSGDDCLCLVAGATPVSGDALGPSAAVALHTGAPTLRTGRSAACRLASTPLPGVSAAGALDAGHLVSGLMVSFARGLNDTPKLAGILLIGASLGGGLQGGLAGGAVAVLATVMAVGGLLSARRVARVMALEITAMDPAQGFAANVVTSVLVLVATRFGLPVSTTHVTCGALFGIGAAGGGARWRTVASILGAWFLTLPAAAATAAGLYWLLAAA